MTTPSPIEAARFGQCRLGDDNCVCWTSDMHMRLNCEQWIKPPPSTPADPGPMREAVAVVECLSDQTWRIELNGRPIAEFGERDLAMGFATNLEKALASPTLAAPAGWKTVPVEPTEEMISAGCDQWDDGKAEGEIYRAMLAASPAPPIPEGIEALAASATWFHQHRKSIEADIRSAHYSRGNGTTQWMTEDDRDFRNELEAAFTRLADALVGRGGAGGTQVDEQETP